MYIADTNIWMSNLDSDESHHPKNGNLPTEKERKMLGIKLIDKVPNLEIREKTKVKDVLVEITKLKWKWAGHVARMKEIDGPSGVQSGK